MTGKSTAWIPNPSLHILMHEPPAKRYGAWFVHWHYARRPTDVHLDQVRRDSQRFVSPILFVDGHSAKHDFTKVLKANPAFPYEPAKDWVWYKPAH